MSLSCCVILISSSTAKAYGRPTKRAVVVTTQAIFPPINTPTVPYEVAVENLEAIDCRVEGGMISCKAAIRCQIVSSRMTRPRS